MFDLYKKILEYYQEEVDNEVLSKLSFLKAFIPEDAGNVKYNYKTLAFEDMEHKQWIIYDSTRADDKAISRISFGSITMFMLNYLKNGFVSPKYKNGFVEYFNHGISENILNFWREYSKEIQEDIEYIFDIFSDYEYRQKTYSPEEFGNLLHTLWEEYRYISIPRVALLKNCFTSKEGTDEFLKKYGANLSPELKELFFNMPYEMVSNSVDYRHIEFSKHLCIYHDTMLITDKFKQLFCRCYCLDSSLDFFNLFPLDFLKVLTKEVPVPHKCSRCGFLYLSNNNKAKYCPDCQKNRNVIRNERRKENTARYLHKKVFDKLSYWYKEDKSKVDNFRIESNYYWAIVQGKTPKEKPIKYDKNIKTEEDYIRWLKSKIE